MHHIMPSASFSLLLRVLRVMLLLLTMVGGLGRARAYAQPSGPLMVPPPGKAATERIPLLKEVDIEQHLGAKIPLDLPFVDEQGKDVTLAKYFGARPVVLALVYYECPMLCTQVLNGLASSLIDRPSEASSRDSSARRVGSARAAKVRSSGSAE